MRQSEGSRHAYKSWQLLSRRMHQLWRQKHGRVILIAPVALLLLTIAWSSPSSTSSPAPARALSQAKSHVNTPPQPGQPPSRKWAGAAADITKFVTQPGEESANASVMAAALNSILEFPEDLDGPDQMSLMSVIDPAEFQAKKDFNGLVAPNSRMFRAPGRYKANATRSSLLVAMPSDRSHLAIVEASHAWRKEVSTFVALNDSELVASRLNDTDPHEVWGYYADDWPLKGLHAGDSRAALTPFLAHESFEGQYDWMLYGDDDTFFFIDNILELLQDFDPNLPYIITDHYWWDDATFNYSHYHPHEKAPRCLPCHWTAEDEERSLRADGYKPFVGYPACPCTVEHICKHDERGLFNEQCDMPSYPERAYSIHGGAGAILSIGLMKQLPLDFMERCLADISNGTGGDAFLSHCIMRAGYGFTDPGYSFYHWEAKAFDPGPEISRQLVQDFSEAVLSTCDSATLDVISHVATAHVRSINQGKKDSAQVIHTLSTVYDRWRAKVNATLAQAQVSLTAAGTRPSGSAAALRAGTNLGRDLADIPKTVPDPVDDLKDHSTRSMITRATQVLQNSNSSTARASTAGKAGTGTMTAADILNDVRSSLEGNDVGSTDSSANTAAQLLRDAAASHDDTMTAGTARIAGAAAAAATTGAAGEHAMTAEDVLLDATSDGGFEFEASAGKALTAGSNTMSAADVMNDIASSQAAVGIGDIGDATLQDPRRSAGSQALPAEVQITQGHHSTEFSLGDIDNMDYGDMGSTDLLGEFGSDAGSSGHDSAAAATIRNAASQAQPTRDLENEMKSEDDENMSHGLPQHATSRAASGVRSSAAASTSQGRDAASARQAAEIDSDIDRLLETASSGGMSAGLEFDLSADDSPGSIVREMQASRGNPDQQSRMLPLL